MGIKVRFWKGAWWVFVNYRGRRRAKRIGESQETAERVKRELEARLGVGDTKLLDADAPVPALKAYADHWLKTDARRCKPSTVDFYDDYLHRYVIPRFGEKRLTEITRAGIKEFLADLAKRESRQKGKLSRNTIRMALASLRVMLHSAVEDGILTANPGSRMGRYVVSGKPEHKAQAMEPAEVERFLAEAKGSDPEMYPLFMTALYAGLRQGEILGLKWGDVQFGKSESDPDRFLLVERR